MKFIGRLFTALLLLGNLALLAALSLHIVVTQGKLAVVAKDHLTLMETCVDVRQWTPADLQAHPALLSRLTEAGRLDLVAHVGTLPQVPRTQTSSLPGFQSPNPPIDSALNVPASLVTQVRTPAQETSRPQPSTPAPVNPLARRAAANTDKPTAAENKSIFNED